jgi:vacuolar-type H+-ATPase subunit H
MTDPPEPSERSRPHVEASRRVAQIMRAAEDAAAELTAEAERRADARIAEAARASENRVKAAEEEAADILGEAQRQAAVLHETATSDADRIRGDARREAAQILEEARQQADEVQRIAEVFAVQTREGAEEDARRHVNRARELAQDILNDGTEMSHNLRQLADSLRRNAETILLDVTRAHRALTARLDESDFAADVPAAAAAVGSDFGDVPEFIPRAPRRAR